MKNIIFNESGLDENDIEIKKKKLSHGQLI